MTRVLGSFWQQYVSHVKSISLEVSLTAYSTPYPNATHAGYTQLSPSVLQS